SWTESTVTWNNVGAFSTAVNAGGMLNQSARVEFDITSFAKRWKNLSYTNTMSVIFTMSGDETSYLKQFDSSECANTDRRPYVVFTYQLKNRLEEGIYYIRNRHIDKYLQPTNGSSLIGTGLELNAFSGNDAQKWEVISRGNGFYTVKNVSSGYVLSVPSGSYSTYDVQLTQTVDTQADGQLWRIYMTSYCGFAIKPKSACGPGDGTGWSDRTMSVADGNDGNGALVTQRPYVYNNSYKDEWYLVPTDVPGTGDLPITNRQLGTRVQPYGGIVYSNNSVVLWEQTSNNAQKWNFTSVGDGYCKITPKGYSSYALSIASGSETTENGTVRIETYSSGNTRQQWFIYKVPGGYVLKARSCGISNLVLSVSEGNLGNGAVVSQRAYVNNLSYKEEWFIGEPPLDGVYYIINGTMYCEAAWPKAKDHENVDLYELFPPNGDVAFRAAQMWRIKHLGGGRYSVRPLHKLNMGLNAYGSNVDIIDISASDTTYAIDDSAEWCIEPFGDKYVFMNYGDTGKALTATGITNTSNVTVSSYAVGNFFQLWTLTKVPEASIPKDILFYSASSGYIVTNQTRYIAPEEELTLLDMDLIVGVIDANIISQSVNWSVPQADTEYLYYDPYTGNVTGIEHKETGITVTCTRVISEVHCSNGYTLFVTEIPNGLYFLKNKQNGDYAKVKDESLINNQNVVQYDFDANEHEIWFFNLHPISGYYTIQSYASIDFIPYYLQVYNNSTDSGACIVVKEFTGTSFSYGAQWKIKKANGTAYRIIPKTGESPDGVRADYVLVSGTSDGTNNVNTIQAPYSNNSNYTDEWYLYEYGKEEYKLFTFSGASNGSLGIVASYISAKTHKTPYMELFSSIGKERLERMMCDCDFLAINTHGYKEGIQIGNNDYLSMGDIECIDYSGLKLAILLACSTAKDYSSSHITNNTPVNFAEKLVCQGAETVIGFNQDVMAQNAIWFAERFTYAYVNNSSVTAAQAMTSALGYAGYLEAGFEQMVELIGNGNIRFYE
ncbi:MAG: RICIN domain-containing protein, partial [Clostridia bacterium]|nr:RICIN domain-containing protein [Clostridia bacterium]